MRTLIFTLLVAAVLPVAAAAQARGSLGGVVRDQDGALIVGARVRALGASSGREAAARTDGQGRYEIAGLPAGLYRVAVSGAGFEAAAGDVDVQPGATAVRDFTLAPGSLRDSVTVTAARGGARLAADTPQSVTVADARSVEERRPASPLQAVEATPNLTTVGANAAGERPRLRGLASNRLLLLVDGDRLNNVRSDPLSGVSPSLVDVSQLRAVEVVGGAGSSLYGSDALAGTINLITKTPEPEPAGRRVNLRLDFDARTNNLTRRGAGVLGWGEEKFALRLGGALQRAGSYHAGGRSISRDEVVRFGRFVTELGNNVGNNVARTYAVWELPAGAEIPNGQAGGFHAQADAWAFLPREQSLRYRQLNSQHKNIGFPFSAPPFDPRNQFNAFRRLDKYGLRYEGRALAPWLPRVAAGFYRQKYAFADSNLVSTIDEGSSWRLAGSPGPLGSLLTGDASAFSPGLFTDGKSAVTSYGADAQATFALPRGLLVTTGLGYLRDSSRDEFSRRDFTPGAPARPFPGRASNPDAAYRNVGWFNLAEYEPRRWLRLTAGLRVDNWATEARVTPGFPLDTEAAVLAASFDQLSDSPGSINVAGVSGIVDLVNGRAGLETSNRVATGNVGVTLRAPGGVQPYFRWGTSYREPGITERYILRNFGDPTFSVLLVANTELKPERGTSYDAGIKVRRERWNASAGYFRNDLTDFLRPAFGDVLFVPADPARGLLALSPFFPFHGVLYVQRTNTARARIEGVETAFEAGFDLGRFGHLTPYGSAGWLKGSDLTPDPDALAVIRDFYNRADTPVPLAGSATDVPLAAITPFRGVFGLRYAGRRPGWFGEYRARHQSRVRRADPLELTATITTQYGTLASLNSFTRHSVGGGYELRRERHRMLWTLGVENLTNRFHFEHFQNAPAPGRALVFGMTLDFGF